MIQQHPHYPHHLRFPHFPRMQQLVFQLSMYDTNNHHMHCNDPHNDCCNHVYDASEYLLLLLLAHY